MNRFQQIFVEQVGVATGLDYEFNSGSCFNYSSWSFVIITLLNAGLAALLIIVGLPLFIGIGLFIKFKDGGPVLYRGARLGLGKKVFYMYKFRTLPVGSQKKIGSYLLCPTHGLVTPFFKFLRDTRLDELPQLFNILAGDMEFVGPRPMRPEVYEEQVKHISNIDWRFAVRPGLIGYSQLFTPHSSPQRIRSLIDNRFMLKKRGYQSNLIIIAYTVFMVARNSIIRGSNFAWREFMRRFILRTGHEKRKLERFKPQEAKVFLRTPAEEGHGCPASYDTDRSLELSDINDLYLRVVTTEEFNEGEHYLLLERTCFWRGREKRKRARVSATVFRREELRGNDPLFAYVLRYSPCTLLSKYIIDQYFFNRSII